VNVTAAYEPTVQQRQEIDDWFANYDALVAAGNVEAMADQAMFPLNEVTDSKGFGLASATDRDRFIAQMGGMGGVDMRSSRTPIFLSPALVFVVTDAEFDAGGQTTTMRYGDLLIRTPEGWRFQTMVAGGFGDEM
jgi:hypothetical protein